MYRHILISTDGSELADKALEHGLGLAGALNARVTILTVTEDWNSTTEGWGPLEHSFAEEQSGEQTAEKAYEQTASEKAEDILAPAVAAAQKKGVEAMPCHERDALPAPAILRTADAASCDLIVMGSHGRTGLHRFFMGSQATEVMTKATVPVLIVR